MTTVSTKVKEELMKDFSVFEEASRQFFDKELPPAKYKGISGGFGSYAERGYESCMLRLRFPGGLITKDQMKFLRASVDTYDLKEVHFTTGQNIQFHHLHRDETLGMYKEAAEHGIFSRGSGGDFPRNIAASPLRGVDPHEYFDVTPFVKEAAAYILTLVTTLKLPRKYKIGFSSGSNNEGHATFKDLGFLARPDGTFDVYAAGGLGPNPRFGVLVADKVQPTDILYHIHTLGHLFSENGNYENRAHNRTRYLPADMGDDTFRALYQTYLGKAKEESLDFTPMDTTITKAGDGSVPTSPLAKPQKQQGLYYIHYHPLGGMPSMKTFVNLLDTVIPLQDVEIRLNTDESLYIINLTGKEADAVAAVVANSTATNAFETTVSCVGATICQVGIQDSHGLLAMLVKELGEAGVNTDYLPQMHISGCPSSCGTQQIGAIGLHGFVKRVGNEPKPAFKIFAGGCYEAKKEQMAEEVGLVTVEAMPALFTELAHLLESNNTDFATWYAKDPQAFKALISKFE